MPLRSGTTAVPGPTAGANALTARIQVVRLAAQKHDVERLADLGRQDCWRRRQVGVAQAALDRQAGFRKPGGSLRPDKERDVAAGLKQSPAEIPTDRARTNDQNPHGSSSLFAKPDLVASHD